MQIKLKNFDASQLSNFTAYVITYPLLESAGEVNNGDILYWDTESHTGQLTVRNKTTLGLLTIDICTVKKQGNFDHYDGRFLQAEKHYKLLSISCMPNY